MNQKLIIKRLREGNEAAYKSLFTEYYKLLVLFANKYLDDLDASKEIVQDLFVSVYEKRNELDITSSLKSYLFKAVRNRCLNELNSAKIRNRYAEYVKSKPETLSNNPERSLEEVELQNEIAAAVSELPPKCKLIFTMNRYDGLSNSEIAEKLRLSKRTVETQISKALKILRGRLQPYLLNNQ